MDNYFDDFRINLKYYRDQKHWSQAELAIQADSSNGQIGNIESGKAYPSFELILRLASALGIHPADLFIRDVSRISNLDIYQKYTPLIKFCEKISPNKQQALQQLAQSLAEDEAGYSSGQ